MFNFKLLLTIAIISLALIICLFIWNDKFKFPVSDIIQFGVLIILIGTLTASIYDTNLRQRPFVGVSEIPITVLSNKTEFSKINNDDEFLVKIVFENKGLSPAYITSIRAKIFYGLISTNNEGKFNGVTVSTILSAYTGTKPFDIKSDIDKEIPVTWVDLFSEITLLPNHSSEFPYLFNAGALKSEIFIGKMECNPVFTEVIICYNDIHGARYQSNSIFKLVWYRANHIALSFSLVRSSDSFVHKPLTYGQFLGTTAKTQGVAFP